MVQTVIYVRIRSLEIQSAFSFSIGRSTIYTERSLPVHTLR